MAVSTSDKLVTVEQSQEIANGVIAKVKAKGYAVASDLGSLSSLNEVAEANLASALATKINGKADAATTISGYGITDAYTKTEVDNAISEVEAGALRPGGTLAASGIVSGLLIAGNLGKVYNISEDFTTTSDFVEGAGKALPAGTNIYIVDTDTTGSSPTYKFDVLAGAYGVATESGNGLMSSTDKTKLDNADVTAYTGTGAIDVTNHVISISAATTTDAGSMSAADKTKLDNADVTAYTAGNGIDVTLHAISAIVDTSNANGLSVGANGIALATATTNSAGAMSAADKAKLDNADVGAYTAGNGIDITSHAISAVVDSSNANGLAVGASGISLAVATSSTSGAMSSTDKAKLDGFEVASSAEITALIAALDNL